MIKESPTIAIKQDPDTTQEEQEDLILSYLNSDYVSTEPTAVADTETGTDPPSPPYSTCSADVAPSTDIPMNHPSLYMADPLLFHLQSVQGLPVPWPASTAALPTQPFPGPIQDPSCLMNIHPLYIPPANQQPILLPPTQPHSQHLSLSPRSSSCSSVTSSSSDSEQSKKKRVGRKKREVSIVQAPLKPLTKILPAAATAASTNTTTSSYSPPAQQHETTDDLVKTEATTPPPMDRLSQPALSSATPSPEKTPAEIAYAKRQERLIKNRAAALLSRKRKREHLTTLEEERQQLVNENQALHQQVSNLEARVVSLEQENMELKQKLSPKQHLHHHSNSMTTPKHTKATGMVFMIILFSFALFTLPSSHSPDQLTVGGGSTKPNIPLIGSSPSRVPAIELDTIETSDTIKAAPTDAPNTTTDLMLVDHFRPSDLQSWIKEKLVQQKRHQQQQPSHDQQETGLTHFVGSAARSSQQHLYLYTDEFSQITRLQQDDEYGQEPLTTTAAIEPTLSILCPLNTSSSCEPPVYLQIDVQVLGSRILEGELRRKSTTGVNNHRDGGIPLDGDGDISMFDSVMVEKLAKTNDSHRPDDSTAKHSSTERRRQLRKQALGKKRRRFSRVVLD